MKSPTHFQRIDLLRGVAILLVFLHHFQLAIERSVLQADAMVPSVLKPLFLPHEIGYLGVKLFFAISGFCIHNSYLNWRARRPAAPWWDFLYGFFHRRFWRIFPPYLVALGIFFVWQYKGSLSLSLGLLRIFGVHALLINTLIAGFFYNINPSFWSVAVEWQLYLVYPMLLLVLVHRGGGWAFFFATLVAAGFHYVLPQVTTSFLLRHLPFHWWYDWAIGVWVASAFAAKRQIFRHHLPLGIFLVISTIGVMTRWPLPGLTWILPPLTFAVVLEGCVLSKRAVVALERPLMLLGLCSYSFYLFHQPLIDFAVRAVAGLQVTPGPTGIWIFGCTVLFLLLWGLAWLSYRTLEVGSISVGNWLWKRWHPAIKNAATMPAFAPL